MSLPEEVMSNKHVVVLVLGDLGRSPRMQYHAYSISQLNSSSDSASENGHKISLVGYEGEETMEIINKDPCISVYRLPVLELQALRAIAFVHAVAKGLALFLSVLHRLWTLPKYQLIIIQNPPCLPALVAAIIVSWCTGSRIMLDWHNLGFAMFQERLGGRHILVRVARLLECYLASFATHHICVSAAMREWLARHFWVRAVVLYDRPPGIFKRAPATAAERHELLLRLKYTDSALFPPLTADAVPSAADSSTIQTTCTSQGCTASRATARSKSGGKERGDKEGVAHAQVEVDVRLRVLPDRVGLVMSCTSWTADEDFTLLLRALVVVEQELLRLHPDPPDKEAEAATNTGADADAGVAGKLKLLVGFCRLAVVVTGKGPMKAEFEAAVAALVQQGLLGRRVAVRTAWLAPGDYPALLRCADLGVSLHTSTSGLDLPMKVLDMFGSAVPVCACAFPSLHELVRDGHNGLSFTSSDMLAEQLIRLLVRPLQDEGGVPHKSGPGDTNFLKELNRLKEGATGIGCWEDNWKDVMAPIVNGILAKT